MAAGPHEAGVDPVRAIDAAEEKADASVWTTVDRQVSVRVTVPKAVAGEVLVDFSPSIVAAVPTLEAAPARC